MPPAATILERDAALGEKLARALDTRAAADLAAVGIAPERVPQPLARVVGAGQRRAGGAEPALELPAADGVSERGVNSL